LAQVERLTRRKIKIPAGDRDYRGKKEIDGTRILIPMPLNLQTAGIRSGRETSYSASEQA